MATSKKKSTEPSQAAPTGPYCVAALLCEYVLTEKDNVHSLIRIVDRITVQAIGPGAPDQMPETPLKQTLYLSFKSGEARGPVSIKVTQTEPSGLEKPEPLWEGTIHFEGGTRGHNLIIGMKGKLKQPGPYWFNLYVGDSLAARTPLEVIYTHSRGGQVPNGGMS